ncbi:MAG: OmpA family protein [Gammaproteobacteria bacterium]|nr:OmpA family protein [Gammaproteobacteria bacterium]
MNIKSDLHHQHKRQLSKLCCAVVAVVSVQFSTVCTAEDVKMYSSVPSADEMANQLFPGSSSQTSKRPKTRSISFDPVETATAPTPPAAESVGIGLPIQFGYNSDEITGESRPYIDELGKMLSRDDLRTEKIVIEGHTDASGSSQYNQKLSERRAKAVKDYLFYKYGIERDRLVILGKGEYSPLSGQDPYASVNRRVEIHKYHE